MAICQMEAEMLLRAQTLVHLSIHGGDVILSV
jgi:hypothetical protein